MTIIDIQKLTESFAGAYAALAGLVAQVEEEQRRVRAQHAADVRGLLRTALERKAKLNEAIEGNPELFERPRTQVFAEVKVGLRKQKGKLVFPDVAALVGRIEAIYGRESPLLRRPAPEPDRAALNKLTAAELRKLGVELQADTDVVVIEPVAGDLSAAVAAVLEAE